MSYAITHFQDFVYKLHETVNKMLGKNLDYLTDVRERYEHCDHDNTEKPKIFKFKKTRKRKKRVVQNHYMSKKLCVIKLSHKRKNKTLMKTKNVSEHR